MSLLWTLLFVLLGLFIGSFLNVCIDRLPQGQSLVKPPSHCPNCNRQLSVADLVPIFSYLWLRGKCRYCQAHIPVRLPLVEGTTALLFAFLYWKYGLGLELGVLLIYSSLLIVFFVIDLENHLILNKVTYPAMVLAFAVSFFRPEIKGVNDLGGGAISQAVTSWAGDAVAQAVICLVGGLLCFVVMSIPVIIYPAGMAWGDVKLAALMGLMTGYPLAILGLLLSWIGGGLVAAVLLLLKIRGRKDEIPSGTFLALATLVTLVWGGAILRWYL